VAFHLLNEQQQHNLEAAPVVVVAVVDDVVVGVATPTLSVSLLVEFINQIFKKILQKSERDSQEVVKGVSICARYDSIKLFKLVTFQKVLQFLVIMNL
jgi:hypothetical protein